MINRNLLLSCCLIAGLAVSCSQKNFIRKESLCTAVSTGDTVVFGYNRPVSLFQACRDNIQASISQVTDSRCPEDVTCIWAGKVNALLQLNADFSLNLEKDVVIDTVYMGRHYSFSLVDVTPRANSQKAVEPADRKTFVRIVRTKN
ncbi:MAG: hypothetical protein JO301_13765 [Chitinophagaceae bacterium]|nr:hypothetical protein [Chitinophagaceae bacterium]